MSVWQELNLYQIPAKSSQGGFSRIAFLEMIKQLSTLKSLQICPRCLNHEINSWVNERWIELDEETKKQIHEELKAVKIKQGNCLVCKEIIVSDNVSERIFNILEQNKISEETKNEFKKFFFEL